MPAKRIAVACQGGSTQTAFTAGALQKILEKERNGQFDIVALSGTSGGAVCALLAWCELLSKASTTGGGTPGARLQAFWETGYPDGNASLFYPLALLKGGTDFWQKGRPFWWGPWLDRLRNDTMYMADVGSDVLNEWMPALWWYFQSATKPYWCETWLRPAQFWALPITPALIFSRTKAKEVLENWSWMQTFVDECFALAPVFEDNHTSRAFDAQTALKVLLKQYLDQFDLQSIKASLNSTPDRQPELLIGAVDVQHTHPYKPTASSTPENQTNFKVFRGSKLVLGASDWIPLIDAVVASAAMPSAMRAVRINGEVYWDGLYSQNPPVLELPDVFGWQGNPPNPEEIWIIQVNPDERDRQPKTIADVEDRRNELSGNISLKQEVRAIRNMDGMVRTSETDPDRLYPEIDFKFICMSKSLSDNLMMPSKMNRSLEFLHGLFEDGQKQAA